MLIKSLSRMAESVEYYNSTECLIQYLVISHFTPFKFCTYGTNRIILRTLVEEENGKEIYMEIMCVSVSVIFIHSMTCASHFHKVASSITRGSFSGLFTIHK